MVEYFCVQVAGLPFCSLAFWVICFNGYHASSAQSQTCASICATCVSVALSVTLDGSAILTFMQAT